MLSKESKIYQKEAIDLAFSFCPPIYPCGKCGHPVMKGYCCGSCGTDVPEYDKTNKVKYGGDD